MGDSSSTKTAGHHPGEGQQPDLVKRFMEVVGIEFTEAVSVVYSKARALSRHDPVVANDLAQDVWEHIYTLIREDRLHQTVEYPAAWLRRLVQNQWLQKRRQESAIKRGGHVFVESLEQRRATGHEPVSEATGPEATAVQADLERRLYSATSELPPHLRAVVTLVLKGHTHTEIAALLVR